MRRLWRMMSGDSTMLRHRGREQRLHDGRIEQLVSQQQGQQRETELAALARPPRRCAPI